MKHILPSQTIDLHQKERAPTNSWIGANEQE